MIAAVPNLTRCYITCRYFEYPLKRIVRSTYFPHLPLQTSVFKTSIVRDYSQQDRKDSNTLVETKHSRGEVSTATAFETVKENTKTAWNLGVILLGVGITGSILWAIFRELFSSNSPNNIYSKALDRCIADTQIQDHLGEPIKGYGEETRRGRRRLVSHSMFQRDGRTHMLMKFYIQGTRKKGTVFVEMREDDEGTFQYNYMVVQLDDMLKTQIVLENNRHLSTPSKAPLPSGLQEMDLTNLQ